MKRRGDEDAGAEWHLLPGADIRVEKREDRLRLEGLPGVGGVARRHDWIDPAGPGFLRWEPTCRDR